LIREWEGQAKRQLATPEPISDDHLNLLYDQTSLLLYIRSIDHWASTGTATDDASAFQFPHWAVGLLLHSPFPRNRWLGVLTAAAQLQSGCKETRLLLGNSVGRLLDGDEDSVLMGLRLAFDCLDSDSAALFSPGVRRALRSRFPKVRTRAWMVFGKMISLDSGIHIDDLEAVQLAKKEEHGCVLTRIVGFLSGQPKESFPPESALLIANDIYRRLMRNRWTATEVTLISKTLWLLHRLHPFSPEDIPELHRILQRIINELDDGHAKEGLCLEILRIIASIKGADYREELGVAGLAMPFFAKGDQLAAGLKILEILARISPSSVLAYQQQLLTALASTDPAIVLLALQIMLLVSNQTNYLSIMEAFSKLYLDKSVDLGMRAQAMRKTVHLVAKFDLDRPGIAQKIVEKIMDEGSSGFGEAYVEQFVEDLLGNHVDILKTSKWTFVKDRAGSYFGDLCLAWLFGKHSFACDAEREFLLKTLQSYLEENDELSCVIVLAAILRTGVELGEIDLATNPRMSRLVRNPDWCHPNYSFDQVLEAAHKRMSSQKEARTFDEDCKLIDNIFQAAAQQPTSPRSDDNLSPSCTSSEEPPTPFATLQDMSAFPSSSSAISDLFKGIR
jgi:hypothetical protein